ncbi:baseplate J/gp47 family protein [Clostridium sp. LBM24168]
MAEFEIPDFLSEDADTIHERMLSKAPKDVNTIEGDFFWNNTRPAAEEIARVKQMVLTDVLYAAFPQTSYDNYLDYLGESEGLPRNKATFSTGKIKITAVPGTQIVKGKIVCTVGTDDKPSIEFEIQKTTIIDDTGVAYVDAKCTQAGTIGNVPPDNITLLATPINGVKEITNEEQFQGGTDIEDNTHYSARIVEAEQQERLSGSDSDYVRWAKEIDGVGYAYVEEEWNGPGTVKVLILDKNKQAATQELIDAVQNYIAPMVPQGQNRGGLAPTGAIVTIATPTILSLIIKANFVFTSGYDSSEVLENIKNEVNNYVTKIELNGTILLKAVDSIVGSFILQGKGLDDYSNLTMNDGSKNIILNEQVAIVNEVVANAVP